MRPAGTRIADLWCRLMHDEAMWPTHGQYECRTCGRRYRVCWGRSAAGMQHASTGPEAPVPDSAACDGSRFIAGRL
jgi:hypothetical protein